MIPFPPITIISLFKIAAEVPLFATGRGILSVHTAKEIEVGKHIEKNK